MESDQWDSGWKGWAELRDGRPDWQLDRSKQVAPLPKFLCGEISYCDPRAHVPDLNSTAKERKQDIHLSFGWEQAKVKLRNAEREQGINLKWKFSMYHLSHLESLFM